MTTKPAAAFFAMPQPGHFHGLRPLIAGLARRGVECHVFTHGDFRADVERAGAAFTDLFSKYPLDAVDAESDPAPSRFVSFAGRYAGEILDDLSEIRPALVVHDQHAVIGRVVGAALGIPYVTVCPAHHVGPARLTDLLASLPRVSISRACRRAVAVLQERYGLREASPFSFVADLSPFLNVYGEPPPFLSDAQRRALEPVAFHGCLPLADEIEANDRSARPRHFDADPSALKVYVSFGTVVWRYWPDVALDALRAISDSLGRRPQVSAVISLGGGEVVAEALRALEQPNVAVTGHVDQWEILREADAFITHNGLKSTHEASFHRVPMISYPIFWDQPALAERCRVLGLAVPLVAAPRAPVTDEAVGAALAGLSAKRESLAAGLAAARGWELDVLDGRDAVLQRIVDLIAT